MDQDVLINAMVQLAALEAEQGLTRARLGQCRTQLRNLDELHQEVAGDAEEAGAGAMQSEAALHNREMEIQALEETIARKQAQHEQLGDERLRLALAREIAALEDRCDLLLEKACELLGRSEEQQCASRNAQVERDDLDLVRRTRSEELQGLQEQSLAALKDIEAEIEQLVSLLPEQIVRDLRRHWSREQTAVVALEQGACGGCFGQLPAQQADSADRGKALVRCPSCARFVVHKPWR